MSERQGCQKSGALRVHGSELAQHRADRRIYGPEYGESRDPLHGDMCAHAHGDACSHRRRCYLRDYMSVHQGCQRSDEQRVHGSVLVQHRADRQICGPVYGDLHALFHGGVDAHAHNCSFRDCVRSHESARMGSRHDLNSDVDI